MVLALAACTPSPSNFVSADIDGDGRLDQADYSIAALEAIQPGWPPEDMPLFESVDADSSGCISLEEAIAANIY